VSFPVPASTPRHQLTTLGDIPVTEATRLPKWLSHSEPQPRTKDELSGLTFSKTKLFRCVCEGVCAAWPNAPLALPLLCTPRGSWAWALPTAAQALVGGWWRCLPSCAGCLADHWVG
jgi:hypothetical protein